MRYGPGALAGYKCISCLLTTFCCEQINSINQISDAAEIDQLKEIPESVIDGLKARKCYAMMVPKEYGSIAFLISCTSNVPNFGPVHVTLKIVKFFC